MDYLENIEHVIDSDVNYLLSPISSHASLIAALKLFLVIYAGVIAPQLPSKILHVFDNPVVKIAVLFLIVWSSSHDPGMAILVAVSLFVSLNLLAGRKAFDTFQTMQQQHQ